VLDHLLVVQLGEEHQRKPPPRLVRVGTNDPIKQRLLEPPWMKYVVGARA